MDIQSEKLKLIRWISSVEDLDILLLLKQIMENESGGEEGLLDLSPAEIAGIERGLKDIEEGRIHSHEEVKEMYEKYLSSNLDKRS